MQAPWVEQGPGAECWQLYHREHQAWAPGRTHPPPLLPPALPLCLRTRLSVLPACLRPSGQSRRPGQWARWVPGSVPALSQPPPVSTSTPLFLLALTIGNQPPDAPFSEASPPSLQAPNITHAVGTCGRTELGPRACPAFTPAQGLDSSALIHAEKGQPLGCVAIHVGKPPSSLSSPHSTPFWVWWPPLLPPCARPHSGLTPGLPGCSL